MMLIETLSAFLLTFLFIPLLKRQAYTLNLVDRPNERSMHTVPIARGAGIAVFSASLIVFAIAHTDLIAAYPFAFAGIFAVFILGIVDDVRSKSARIKFGIIILAIVLASFNDVCIHSLGTFFGHEVRLGWVALPFTVFALTGFTNAFNLIDGLDGLAGSIGIIILTALLAIGLQYNDILLITAPALLIAALSAFLHYNWHPASIFLGDSGALSIGFIISLLFVQSLEHIDPTPILFLAALPVLDTVIVLMRRIRHGQPVHNADQTHIHHILLRHFDGDVSRTVITLILLQITFSLLGYFMIGRLEQTIILLLFSANLLMFYLIFSSMLNVQERMQQLLDSSKNT